MKTETIRLTGSLCASDLRDIRRYQSRLVIRPSLRFVYYALSILIVSLLILVGFYQEFDLRLIVLIIFCVWFSFGRWVVSRWKFETALRSGIGQQESTVTLNQESVYCANDESEVRLTWKHIHCIVETPRGLLFVLPPHDTWFWLPGRILSNKLREEILSLAEGNCVTIRAMT